MNKEQIKLYGRGAWWVLHTKSVRAINKKEQDSFIELLTMYQEEYPCVHCRLHMEQYFRENNINEYRNYERGLGFAVYGWKFHNAVNKRLNKPEMSWGEFVDMYIEKIHNCFEDCADDHPKEKEKNEQVKVTFIDNEQPTRRNKFSLH